MEGTKTRVANPRVGSGTGFGGPGGGSGGPGQAEPLGQLTPRPAMARGAGHS